MRESRMILVISLGGLGDFITRWPLWESARATFPAARIVYLGYPHHASLLIAAGLCDEALDYNEARWARPGSVHDGYDLVISLLGARGREWLAMSGTGAAQRIELEPFPAPGERRAVADHLLDQARAHGFVTDVPPCMPADEPSREWAGSFWREHGLEGACVTAIHPGSGAPWKNWPPDRWAGLARAIEGDGGRTLLLSGEAEREIGAGHGAGSVCVAGLELGRLAALLSRCDSYVGNDCGVTHLAAHAGVPTVAIFGPTDPAVWKPRGRAVTVLTRSLPCAPCSADARLHCGERRCLDISVDEVYKCVAHPFPRP